MSVGSMQRPAVAHRYAVEIFKQSPRRLVETVTVDPDFEPALEAARFEAARLAAGDELVLESDGGRVEPIWDAKRGRPYIAGIRATATSSGRSASVDVPVAYFHDDARAASPPLVESGKLAAGEVFEYVVCAYVKPRSSFAPPGERDDAVEPASPLVVVEPVAQVVRVAPGRLDPRWLRGGPEVADEADEDATGEGVRRDAARDEDLPVLIPQDVLDECAAAMRAAGAAETGGVLIGRMCRDESAEALFLQVTAQIRAEHTRQELSSLTFTPETWAAVDAAIDLRRAGEMYLGWWHTHPSGHWCDECPEEKRSRCKLAGKVGGDFFSSHDARFHRAVFPRAYSIALLLSGRCDARHEPVVRLFGWRRGMVAARGFHAIER